MAEIGQAPREKSTSQHSEFRQVLGQKTVHLLAFFILVYVGVEVTIGGWIVTFLINERGGGKSAGYVSSGFFGGRHPATYQSHHLILYDRYYAWSRPSYMGE